MPRKAGQRPKTLGTALSLCGAAIALLTACKIGDDTRLASALEPGSAAPALVSGAVSRIASDGEETALFSFATEPDEGPPSVEIAVFRYEMAPRWEFAEGIKALRPRF